ncbi:MAG TPA: hypothetical protein VKB12_05820 [Pyrinomonadaceae bacterium]|nr:hypothetical protein [Pyrinomonadaceae bacterium]
MKREMLRVVLVCTLLLTFVSPRAFAARDAGGGLTKAEMREARAAAVAFSERLEGTRDFAAVVRETYADGFMSHYLKREARWAAGSTEAGSKVETFMLEGVPGLDFRVSLAARDDDEHWPRLYAAANDMMHFFFLAFLSKHRLGGSDGPGESDADAELREVYPPEVFKVLDSNPVLANFLKSKGREVEVETAEDLRAVTETMEEAARLARAAAPARPSSSPLLEENLSLLKSVQAKADVTLVEDEEVFGYPKGTRLFRVFASAGYDLLLIKEGGMMKVAWATFPHD